ncbi:MAG: hypothetical protein GX660_00600 [Clostridiaceae bacterium]|nr:hypothetical protein [Clostridiaceae bacterium]
MPKKIDPKNDLKKTNIAKNLNIVNKDLIKDINVKTDLPTIESPVADLNISLSKEQLEIIIRQVIGRKGEKLNPKALASEHCCVDVSVGSSVAGPVSSVASSVSIPNPDAKINAANKVNVLKHSLKQNIDANKAKVNVTVPQNVTVK